MTRLPVLALRLLLVVIALGSVLAQVLVAVVAGQLADEYPEVADLAVPYTVAAVLAIGCAQVALVLVWRLLSLVATNRVFTTRAPRWVDGITIAFGVGTLLTAAVAVHLLAVVGTGGPALALALIGAVVLGTALVLLMVVMRGLLVAAIADRGELDEVI